MRPAFFVAGRCCAITCPGKDNTPMLLQLLLYFLLAIGATTAGAITGMGGGVIMKPVLDAVGQFDAATINVLTAFTVLTMSVVSVARHLKNKTNIDLKVTIAMAVGSVAGGFIGSRGITLLIQGDARGTSFVVQNSILAVMILLVYVYMRNKHKIKGFGLKGPVPSLLVGLFLGALASFLGVGGGPINVALIILLFGYTTRQAAVSSIVIVLFSHLTKVGGLLVQGNFAQYDLSVLPVMLVGAVAGGLIGSQLQLRLSDKAVDKAFNAVQLVVFVLCIVNIIRYV